MGYFYRLKIRLLFGRGMAKFFMQIFFIEKNLEYFGYVQNKCLFMYVDNFVKF